MADKTDKTPDNRENTVKEHISRRKKALANRKIRHTQEKCQAMPAGFDPELLYVECGRCGAPVLWEPGRISKLLAGAGIDPTELDSTCMLVTDACPACGQTDEYSVRIFKLTDKPGGFMPPRGHA